jgi:hypothetical protein
MYSLVNQTNNDFNIMNVSLATKIYRMLKPYISDDFLGYLKDYTAEIKKVKVLEIYRFLYRFSLEKVRQFVGDPSFYIICLHYLQDSKMQRMHQKKIL